MNENIYEAQLRKALRIPMESDRIRDLGDSSPFFTQLMKIYPTMGSKIDWGGVPCAIERTEKNDAFQVEQFISFIDEVIHKFHLTGDVVYVGDSATDFALGGAIEWMKESLPELLAIPQHHYLIGPEFSWCISVTMEGDMGFGFVPSRTKGY